MGPEIPPNKVFCEPHHPNVTRADGLEFYEVAGSLLEYMESNHAFVDDPDEARVTDVPLHLMRKLVNIVKRIDGAPR